MNLLKSILGKIFRNIYSSQTTQKYLYKDACWKQALSRRFTDHIVEAADEYLGHGEGVVASVRSLAAGQGDGHGRLERDDDVTEITEEKKIPSSISISMSTLVIVH